MVLKISWKSMNLVLTISPAGESSIDDFIGSDTKKKCWINQMIRQQNSVVFKNLANLDCLAIVLLSDLLFNNNYVSVWLYRFTQNKNEATLLCGAEIRVG